MNKLELMRFELIELFLNSTGCELKLLEVTNNVTSVTAKVENVCLAQGYEIMEICNSDLMVYIWKSNSC
tara:strand:+ start:418 stop:624 length:207 start_codon:yes stop_codon:yes gene_type:complete